MSDHQHSFVSDQYSPRANDYVTSIVHASGEDLDQVQAMVRGHSDAKVLDLGCGGGHISYAVAPHVREVVACDLTPAMLEAVQRTAAERGLANIAVRQSAAETLPFGDGEFDFVACRFTTHHWKDMDAGLREARRVLAGKGRAIFIDAVAPAHPLLDSHLQTVELLRDPSHVRDYTMPEWVAALARAKFAVTSVTSRKLRMDFPVWAARTRTPESMQQAIRMVQVHSAPEVRAHFAISEDGSFDLDVLTLEVAPV